MEERSPEGHHQLEKSLSCELLGPGRRTVGTQGVLGLGLPLPSGLDDCCRKDGGLYEYLVEPLQLVLSLCFLCSYVYCL